MSIDQSHTHPGEDEKHHAEASDTGTQPDYEEGRPPTTLWWWSVKMGPAISTLELWQNGKKDGRNIKAFVQGLYEKCIHLPDFSVKTIQQMMLLLTNEETMLDKEEEQRHCPLVGSHRVLHNLGLQTSSWDLRNLPQVCIDALFKVMFNVLETRGFRSLWPLSFSSKS